MKMHDLLNQLLSKGESFRAPGPLDLTLKEIKYLVNHKFPNVRALEYEIHESMYEYKIQPEFYLLPEIFPGLNSLKLSGGLVTGFSFDKFKHLRKLELWRCYDFSDYLTGHETLEELIIDLGVNENQYYAYVLKNFPKLTTIAYSLDDSGGHSYFHDTIEERRNDITELSFNEFICCYIGSRLQLPQNLRRLSVINDYALKANELQTLIAGTRLEQLDLVDTKVFSSEIQIWETVTVCPSLKILNISGIRKPKNDFFELSRHHMDQALANRSEPLALHCHKTGVSEQLMEKNFKHPNLKVSFLPLPVKMISQGYVEIKFHPLIVD